MLLLNQNIHYQDKSLLYPEPGELIPHPHISDRNDPF
jgi:hypothetical protein